jgi:hypothetical protein
MARLQWNKDQGFADLTVWCVIATVGVCSRNTTDRRLQQE